MRKFIVYIPICTVLKASEGGPCATDSVKFLKHHGIRAKTEPSCYVGMTTFCVEKGKVTKARKILRKAGMDLGGMV